MFVFLEVLFVFLKVLFVFLEVLFVFLEVLFVCFFQKVPSTETAVLIVRIKHLSARKTMIYFTLLPT